MPRSSKRYWRQRSQVPPVARGVTTTGTDIADLFLADGDAGTAVPVPHGPLLYHNNRNLTFTDVSESLGLTDASYPQWGAAWGDYDNNGLPDILVGDAYWPFLYSQSETGFVDVAGDAGFHIAHSSSYSQNWCDYNGDNLLDAFSSNIFGPGYLMRNNGDETFTEMSAAAGMIGDAANDSTLGASWVDYDNDGLPDLVLARLAKPTKLYRNNGDGTFTDVSDLSGVDAAVDCLERDLGRLRQRRMAGSVPDCRSLRRREWRPTLAVPQQSRWHVH